MLSTFKYGDSDHWNGKQFLVKLEPQIIRKYNSNDTSSGSLDTSDWDDYGTPQNAYKYNTDLFGVEGEVWD